MEDEPFVELNKADIIKEGWLMKQSKFMKDWRRRWLVLTPQYLLSYRSPTSDYSARNVTEYLRLNECSTVKSMEDANGCKFRVDSIGRTFVLIADTAQDKECWIGFVGKTMVKPSMRNYDDVF